MTSCHESKTSNQQWGPLVPRQVPMLPGPDACAWWCGMYPCRSSSADYADVNGFEWSNVPFTSLIVPGVEWHSSSSFSEQCSHCCGHQHGMWPNDVYLSVTLPVSRYLCCNLLMTLCNTPSSLATFVWELFKPVGSMARLLKPLQRVSVWLGLP